MFHADPDCSCYGKCAHISAVVKVTVPTSQQLLW